MLWLGLGKGVGNDVWVQRVGGSMRKKREDGREMREDKKERREKEEDGSETRKKRKREESEFHGATWMSAFLMVLVTTWVK